MKFSDIARLLDPTPMPLEMGFERLDDGVLHVAIRTDMHGCTAAMFDWWFCSRPMTREYSWWHPRDHVSSDWIEGTPGTPVGSIHVVEEGFTKVAPEKLSIQFRDPHEVFDPAALAAAKQSGAVSTVVTARGGGGHDPKRTPAGDMIGSRMIHLGRNTDWGLVLRTHFFLGHDLPGVGMPLAKIQEIFPDRQGPNLLQHCYDEFTFLSRFLPSLYIAENRDVVPVKLPW